MLILPTEKRIDWKRPPFVLIGLVLVNVLVFFLYQSDDEERYFDALEQYQKHDFIAFEAEAYLYYLRHSGFQARDPVTYSDYQALLSDEPDALIEPIVLDRQFYHFLQENPEWVPNEKYEVWSLARPLIEKKIASTSWLAMGLIPQKLNLVTLVTHQFLHGGFMHLLGNMVFLLLCGFAVEAAIGHWRFLLFYLLGGIAGGLLFAVVERWTGDGGRPLVGASGAISGVMAMYLMLFRLKKIEFFYWVFFLVGYFRAPALLILPLYIGNELISFLNEDQAAVAYMAHAGGFVGGALLVGLTLISKPDVINQEYLDEDQSVDVYRTELDKLYRLIGDFQFDAALKHLDYLIETYGDTPALQMQRFNLLRIEGGEDWFACGRYLLCQRGFKHELIRAQIKVWENAEEPIKQGLNDEERMHLAIRFMELEYFKAAEAIANDLVKRDFRDLMMLRLMNSLSAFYLKRKNQEKHQHFQCLANDYQQGVA